MITIAIANEKGGTGKTTSAVTIGTGLARAGKRVVIVDTDGQGHVGLYLGLPPADDIFRLLVADAPITSCLAQAGQNGSSVLVLRSGHKTAVAKTVLAAQRAPIDCLSEPLSFLRAAADFVVIDTAPSVDPLGLATLYAADYVIVPALCETLSLDGLRSITATLEDVRKTYHGSARLLGILPTKYRAGTKEHLANLRTLADKYGRLVYPPIPLSTVVTESTAYRQTLWDYAPTHPASEQYRRVVERILADVESKDGKDPDRH